jgi:hypothetical protein
MRWLSLTVVPFVCTFLIPTVVNGEENKPQLTDKQFRRLGVMLLEDPLGKSGRDYARAIAVFVMQTPNAAVVLGTDEMKWCGKDEKYGLLLMAAYMAGNAQSQLHSGVKTNDRYAGVLSLFSVYRTIREQDKDFKLPEVDELLKLHKDGKLLKRMVDLEAKQPTKLTPEEEEAIQKIIKGAK